MSLWCFHYHRSFRSALPLPFPNQDDVEVSACFLYKDYSAVGLRFVVWVFFSPNKLYKKESAGKMAIKFHLSLLEHFFLSFASAKQENSLGIVASK